MESRREQAMKNFRAGYNCTQAVVLAHSDLLGADTEQILKLCQSFGGGMGRLRQVCGTVSAMFLVAGALTGSADDAVQRLAAAFEAKNGSIVCRELLGLDKKKSSVAEEYRTGSTPEPRTEEYYKKRPCLNLIGDACDVLAEIFPDE